MAESVFGYPGAKTLLSSWIIDHFPAHETYIEPFGGSAAVLVNKAPSYNEIFNDVDGDIVHFFEMLRDDADELTEWLRARPYSRDLHLKYAHEFYDGYRPEDDIERAGRFFYLRNTQFAQKFVGVSGFRLGVSRNHANEYVNRIDALDEFRERLRGVQIENLDYGDLVERTDRPGTLYYFDPPYLDVDRPLYTNHEGFDHGRFVDVLEGIEGRWVVSYTTLPNGLRDGHHVVEKDKRNTMRAGVGGWEAEDTERLVMNFDPGQTPLFSTPEQTQLPGVATDGGGR